MAYQRAVRNTTTNLLWIYVVALLKKRRMYAYEIGKEIQREFGFKVATVTVYAVLYKMEREGLVKSVKSNVLLSPSRKFYELTPRGAKIWGDAIEYVSAKLLALKKFADASH
ncbi:MAG: PadR family transcriptional regulator [Candidatus Marsarchaeota archaeon]|nr:PadR family transcriptional regulator [Candidatus Marsarchaeota archaeon]